MKFRPVLPVIDLVGFLNVIEGLEALGKMLVAYAVLKGLPNR